MASMVVDYNSRRAVRKVEARGHLQRTCEAKDTRVRSEGAVGGCLTLHFCSLKQQTSSKEALYPVAPGSRRPATACVRGATAWILQSSLTQACKAPCKAFCSVQTCDERFIAERGLVMPLTEKARSRRYRDNVTAVMRDLQHNDYGITITV